MGTALEHTTVSRISLALDTERPPRRALLVMSGSGVVTFPLPDHGDVTIGRSKTCVIAIDDPMASREHAVVRVRERIEIADLGSSNGTKIGDRPLAPNVPEPIGIGDIVSIGATVLMVKPIAGDDAAAPTKAGDAGPRAPIVGGALDRMRSVIARVAAGTIPVLILGETGAGKDVLARMLHALSPRADKPFVVVNCAALPEQLLEAELFGYERGAFTGARQAKAGLLESAEGGTVFLDEVGEIPLAIQPKLLRALDQREVLRIGALRPRAIDVRFVAATNRDLEADVARGAFREDLYYRLNGAPLVVPPLRERAPEIEPLARQFAADASRALGRCGDVTFELAAVRLLEGYGWPGNVRELRHVIERAVLLSDGGVIGVRHLPAARLSSAARPSATVSGFLPRPRSEEAQRAQTIEALAQCDGNQTHAARQLGISRRALIARMAKYGLERPRNGTRP